MNQWVLRNRLKCKILQKMTDDDTRCQVMVINHMILQVRCAKTHGILKKWQ